MGDGIINKFKLPKQKSEPTLDPNKEYSTLIYAAFSKSDDEMCTYDEAFTVQEMLEETGQCKDCKLNCPNAGKRTVI